MDFCIRKVRRIHGPMKPPGGCFRLVQQGCCSKEVARLVGVNERTGREWRDG